MSYHYFYYYMSTRYYRTQGIATNECEKPYNTKSERAEHHVVASSSFLFVGGLYLLRNYYKKSIHCIIKRVCAYDKPTQINVDNTEITEDAFSPCLLK